MINDVVLTMNELVLTIKDLVLIMNDLVITINDPALSPVAKDLEMLDSGTHSKSAESSPVKSERKICVDKKRFIENHLMPCC